jgi:hypothetical protein
MKSLLKTADPVLFGAAETLMKDSDLNYVVLNGETVLENSLMQQILVDDDDYEEARKLLIEGLKPRPRDTES